MSTAKVCDTNMENCVDLNRNEDTHAKLVNKLCNPALISSGKSEGQMKREDALKILELEDGKLTAITLKDAYRKSALKYPEPRTEENADKMKKINAARDMLEEELEGEGTGAADADDPNEGKDDDDEGTTDNSMKIAALKKLEWAAFAKLMKEKKIFEGEESEWKIKKDEWEEKTGKERAMLLSNAGIGTIQGGRRHRRGGTKRRRKKKSKRRKSKRRKKARKSKRRKSRKKRSKRRRTRRRR